MNRVCKVRSWGADCLHPSEILADFGVGVDFDLRSSVRVASYGIRLFTFPSRASWHSKFDKGRKVHKSCRSYCMRNRDKIRGCPFSRIYCDIRRTIRLVVQSQCQILSSFGWQLHKDTLLGENWMLGSSAVFRQRFLFNFISVYCHSHSRAFQADLPSVNFLCKLSSAVESS